MQKALAVILVAMVAMVSSGRADNVFTDIAAGEVGEYSRLSLDSARKLLQLFEDAESVADKFKSAVAESRRTNGEQAWVEHRRESVMGIDALSPNRWYLVRSRGDEIRQFASKFEQRVHDLKHDGDLHGPWKVQAKLIDVYRNSLVEDKGDPDYYRMLEAAVKLQERFEKLWLEILEQVGALKRQNQLLAAYYEGVAAGQEQAAADSSAGVPETADAAPAGDNLSLLGVDNGTGGATDEPVEDAPPAVAPPSSSSSQGAGACQVQQPNHHAKDKMKIKKLLEEMRRRRLALLVGYAAGQAVNRVKDILF